MEIADVSHAPTRRGTRANPVTEMVVHEPQGAVQLTEVPPIQPLDLITTEAIPDLTTLDNL
jgi:hypothetical protein